MKPIFRKMMREQVQTDLNNPSSMMEKPAPKGGWIQVIRHALGISGRQLAKRLGCSQANITTFENNERKKTISLAILEKVAQAMNCRLVYFFVPNKPFEKLLEDQARLIAKKRLRSVGHSMELENQGLTPLQKKQQENELVAELLQGSSKALWDNEDEI